jgi:hypothetical protein
MMMMCVMAGMTMRTMMLPLRRPGVRCERRKTHCRQCQNQQKLLHNTPISICELNFIVEDYRVAFSLTSQNRH